MQIREDDECDVLGMELSPFQVGRTFQSAEYGLLRGKNLRQDCVVIGKSDLRSLSSGLEGPLYEGAHT